MARLSPRWLPGRSKQNSTRRDKMLETLLLLLLICLISIPATLALYWALKNPEEAFSPGVRRNTIALIVIVYVAFALFPLLYGQSSFTSLLVAYPLLYAVLFRERVRAMLGAYSEKGLILFTASFLLLWFVEVFVVLDFYPELLIQHLLGYAGFYLGIALTIILFYRRWRYSFSQLFTIGGLWGVIIEQEFRGPKLLLSGMTGDFESLLNFILLAAHTFPVYGLYLTSPYLLFYEEFKGSERTSRWQSLVLFVAILIIPLLTWGIWSLVLGGLGIDLSGVQ